MLRVVFFNVCKNNKKLMKTNTHKLRKQCLIYAMRDQFNAADLTLKKCI